MPASQLESVGVSEGQVRARQQSLGVPCWGLWPTPGLRLIKAGWEAKVLSGVLKITACHGQEKKKLWANIAICLVSLRPSISHTTKVSNPHERIKRQIYFYNSVVLHSSTAEDNKITKHNLACNKMKKKKQQQQTKRIVCVFFVCLFVCFFTQRPWKKL